MEEEEKWGEEEQVDRVEEEEGRGRGGKRRRTSQSIN